MKNEYLPYPVKIRSIQQETPDTKTIRVVFEDKARLKSFDYQSGQFAQVSVLGFGEAPISIASSPTRKGYLEFTIRAMGKLTQAIHKLKVADTLHIRGPFGKAFPFQEAKGENLHFIAGGIGLPPLRGLINAVMDRREEFGKIKILYGAKTPDELCFKEELKGWKKMPNTEVFLTVDQADQIWKENVGVVTSLCDITDMRKSCGIAYVCGPPIMIKFVVEKLLDSGFKEEHIFISLERYMKCGIGKCGHCNIGEKFVCIDGPVFSYRELKRFPEHERAIV